MLLSVQNQNLVKQSHFINGHWISSPESHFEIRDPADDSLIVSVSDGTAVEAMAALEAASAAFCTWRHVPAKDRAKLLKKWNDLIIEHQKDLGRILSREQGKPLAEAVAEVAYAASYVEWFAEEATRANGDVIPPPMTGRRMLAIPEPVGVVATVTPWNFPAAMIARKIAPALAAGCTVVCKPAEDAPLSALALVALAQEAGFPPGVLNIVTASRAQTPDVVDVWLDDPRVRKISFTGSTIVGKHLAKRSADTLKKVSLELGGNAPFIVFDDADMTAALQGLMVSKFRNAGQTCVCPNRVFVHNNRHDEFVERLTNMVQALKVGPASAPDSHIGPLINERAIEKIERHIHDAITKGATLITGGRRLPNIGKHFFEPTVLLNVSSDMACTCEETFGPIIGITKFEDEQEVIAQANNTPYGLAAYFYTNDAKRIWRVSQALETGIVGVNEGALTSEAAPFGGVKASGYGREGSVHGLTDYQHIKYMCEGGLN